MPPWAWWILTAINAVTFVIYGIDKLCARMGRRRVRESSLLWWTLLGGCLGAWCAIGLFRHKTQKTSFRVRAIACTLLSPLWLVLYLVYR